MPRWGYALVAALALALAAYALWPTADASRVAPFPTTLATPFAVSGLFGEQQVGDGHLRVAGLERRVDPKALSRFIRDVTTLRSEARNVVEGIDLQAAKAWGIDGSHRLVVGNEERLWGEAGGTAAIYDPVRRRAYVLAPEVVRGLNSSAARLDLPALVEVPETMAWFLVDQVRFTYETGHWMAVGGKRPPVDARTIALFTRLRSASLVSPGSAPADATAEHELRWPNADDSDARVRLLTLGAQAWLAADGLPPQPLNPGATAAWRTAFAALAADRLTDTLPDQTLEQVTIRRGAAEVLRLERRGEPDDSGDRPWTVVWPEGTEPATRHAGERIANALRSLDVVAPRRSPQPAGPEVVTITIHLQHGATWQASLAGTTVWAAGWAGTASSLPEPLTTLVPATFLDPRPCPLDPLRAVKLQRRWQQDPTRDEVATRSGGGSWTRSFPKAAIPLDPSAVQRVVRALCRLQARNVRMMTAGDRALPHDVELAIRFAAKEARRTGAEDEVELVDTVPQERAWTLTRSGLGWTMLDRNGGLAYSLDAADAEALLADTASDRLYPVASGLIAAIEVGGDDPFRLERHGEDWQVLRTGQPATAADPLAARRLLRALTALRSTGSAATAIAGKLPVAVETVDGERVTVTFASPGPAGIPALTVRGAVLIIDREAWSQVELRSAVYPRP